MNRTPSEIAWWHFSLKDQPADRAEEDALEAVGGLAGTAIQILNRHDLLRPDYLEIESWISPSDEFHEKDRRLREKISQADEESIRAILLEQMRAEQKVPARATIHGSGLVTDADGTNKWIADPVLLTLFTQLDIAVSVSTYIDLWLPYDLQANEQREVSNQNRPRLRVALEELSNLDVNVGNSEVTKFAVVDGLHIRNHTNAFGQPTVVLQ